MAQAPTSKTTPKGIAKYPWLLAPDTKFNPDGDYKVTLVLDAESANPLIQAIDEAMSEAEAKAKKENVGKKIKIADAPYKVNEETGEAEFSFKMKAKVNMKNGDSFEQKPAIFDAKLKPMKDVNVGGGSTIRVNYEPFPFYTALIGAGVSLRLRGVQVIDLQEFSGASGASMGFDEEDGFTTEDTNATHNAEASDEDEDF